MSSQCRIVPSRQLGHRNAIPFPWYGGISATSPHKALFVHRLILADHMRFGRNIHPVALGAPDTFDVGAYVTRIYRGVAVVCLGGKCFGDDLGSVVVA